ncbi:uncharacterized protein Z518_06343 [Rhinocladiella mackenziei CBS 650.93]|uniref:Fungal N-terminal domain-containing protein n=1 Tax=Rhinocladiella mackenziei CBS 650.93 TaxID=1442369 RepID=A0A0D2IQM0_9EURO|nr:uncharacterized protein Z518_06343 [Rhinocladiella mackenziei CBS 650.93]KIX05471.1 hypothetical protein Z518_06343 [Rhinocladiella mackenziei CBS 650.93]
MAEVVGILGLIGSIVNILEGVDKSKTIIKKYVHSSSSLRKELVPILGKLMAFAGILRGLQLECELDESDNGRLQTFEHIRSPLQASEKAAKTIVARLNQVASVGGVSLSLGKVLNNETAAALHVLDQSKTVLDLALTADQRTLLKAIESYVRVVAGDLHDMREESKIQYKDLKQDLNSIRSAEVEATRTKKKADILSWISQVNYSSNYDAASLRTTQNDQTGDWFLKSRDFQDWAHNPGRSGLLLTGISGSGMVTRSGSQQMPRKAHVRREITKFEFLEPMIPKE